MDKETSSRVSTIASNILQMAPMESTDKPTPDHFNALLHNAKAVAASAMSQDETPGQSSAGIHPAPVEFSDAQIAADPVLHFFHYSHLPPTLQSTSRMFFNLAYFVAATLPRSAERTVALRKLLEAKDAAVRASLPAPKIGQKELPLASARPEGEAVETGGHDEDRDGPVPFSG